MRNPPTHFFLERNEDVSGVSGTGRVAEGFVFTDGVVALRWLTRYRSSCFYDSIQDVEEIHGHDGATKIVFDQRAIE
jgi:hypothetical protein